MADDSVQPVPWVFFVAMRGARQVLERLGVAIDVGAVRPVEVPALEQHRGRPERAGGRAPSPSSPSRSGGSGRAEQHRRLGQVGRDHLGERHQAFADRGDGVGGEQRVAALGHHHRVEHDVPRAVTRGARRRSPRRWPPTADHADLDRIDPDVLEHGVDLVGDEGRLDAAGSRGRPRVFCTVTAVTAAMP